MIYLYHRSLVNIDNVIGLPVEVTLNPSMSYNKANKKSRVRCISCAKESMSDMRYPIIYKSIIKHYEHVLHLVGELAGKNGDQVLNWPPESEVIEAAGGVGFGCISMVN